MSAQEFFSQLGEFTNRWMARYLPGVSLECRWVGQQWAGDQPTGAVIHYTADADLRRVMNWFMNPKFNARVSAHAVVCRGWTSELRELAVGLPLVGDLPAPVLQVVDPQLEAWHATWANGWAYGIENLNIGELQRRGDDYFSWRPRDRSAKDWTTPWDVKEGAPVALYGRWWCSYPQVQLETNVLLLKYVQELFGTLQRSLVLGHECVQSNKRDPGPAFLVHLIREMVFGGDWDWLVAPVGDLEYGRKWRDFLMRDRLGGVDLVDAQRLFEGEVVEKLAEGKESDVVFLAFELLDYGVAYESEEVGPDTVLVFQRMMGLKADGVIGPNTLKALAKRLKDRGLV